MAEKENVVDDFVVLMRRSTNTSINTTEKSQPVDPADEMTRRSWLLPKRVATALSDAADGIHYRSNGKISKSAAQAALIEEAIKHAATVEAQLNKTKSDHD